MDRSVTSRFDEGVDRTTEDIMQDWRRQIVDRLGNGPRVIGFDEATAIAEQVRPGIAPKTVKAVLDEATSYGLMKPIRRGLWINQAIAFDRPTMADAASHVRDGAIVSLHTVLGDAGVSNNWTADCYAVVPIEGRQGNPGKVVCAAGTYRFFGIARSLLVGGEDDLDPDRPYRRATLEAAIVHSIYLAQWGRSELRLPDTDADLEEVDLDRLARLASRFDVENELGRWLDMVDDREDSAAMSF